MLKKFIDGVVNIVKSFTGKPSLTNILATVLSKLPELVTAAIDFGGYNSRQKFDEFLVGFDAYTGSDLGAPDLIKNLPEDQEEALWDHIKEAARILGYNRLKISGYIEVEA